MTPSAEKPDPPGDDDSASQATAPSYGRLAKRIRGRTTDLLAIAVILVGGFAVGSQVSGLWDEEAAKPVAATKPSVAPTLFDPNQPVVLDFGQSPFALQRTPFTGSREEASLELIAKCRAAAKAATQPLHALENSERRLLKKLSAAQPVSEEHGRKLYRVDGPVIMASITGPAKSKSDSNRAAAVTRVICWGLAFPIGEKHWITYVFTPRGETRTTAVRKIDIPLPPSATPVLTIRSGRGMTRSFRSTESASAARAYYERWFAKQGWINRRGKDLQSTMVFEKSITGRTHRAELQINGIGGGMCSGLLILTSQSKKH